MPKRKKSSEGQDYISNLPNFIIGHILSFLSTKDAVRTSTLSKRWIYMWTFVTQIRLCDSQNPSPHRRITQFSNFVSRVLFHINGANIQRFNLSLGLNYDAHYINQWLSTVLNKRVKSIYLSSFTSFDLYTYTLFQSPSLEELILRMMFTFILKVPTFISLPSLTVLKLFRIEFTHHSSMMELTLKLPLLKTYCTRNCIWSGIKSVTFEAPLLENVTIFDDAQHGSTKLPMSQTEIKFCASHITKFVYYGYLSPLTLMHTVLVDGHIASADIDLHFGSASVEEILLFVWKLLRLFTSTKCLMLRFTKGIALMEHHLARDFAFQMLGHMQLIYVTGEVLFSLLLKSPCLKTLVLEVEDQANHSDEGVPNFAIVPDCFLSTLKVVKFERFMGGVCELSFAKFVMENALVLERISFSFHYRLTLSEVEKIKEKLLLFKKSFSTVIMEFSPITPPMSVEHGTVEEMPNGHVKVSQAGPSRPRRQLAKPSWMNDYVCNA